MGSHHIPWVFGSPYIGSEIYFEYRIDIFNSIFRELGFQAKKILGVHEAIDDLTANAYRFILSGIKVPDGERPYLTNQVAFIPIKGSGMGGLEILRRVRAEGSVNQETPYYIITDMHATHDPGFPGAETSFLEAGADEFFSLNPGIRGKDSLCGILYAIRDKVAGKESWPRPLKR